MKRKTFRCFVYSHFCFCFPFLSREWWWCILRALFQGIPHFGNSVSTWNQEKWKKKLKAKSSNQPPFSLRWKWYQQRSKNHTRNECIAQKSISHILNDLHTYKLSNIHIWMIFINIFFEVFVVPCFISIFFRTFIA